HLQGSPVRPDENYGFHHGIWSPDHNQFVYLQIQFPHYQLKLFTEGESSLLLDSLISDQRGYLVPLGWKDEHTILLIERFMLYNLKKSVRIWQFNLTDSSLTPYANTAVTHLHGQNTVVNGGAFLGFDAEKGYLFDFESRQFTTFKSALSLPEDSVFEEHPIRILGVLSSSQLIEFINRPVLTSETTPEYPSPFLYWPLPDTQRQITCYPDSVYTAATQEITCPLLGRQYAGHQGTDIGVTPATSVYVAAPGIVVEVNNLCDGSNPSCGEAYGNYITLEHSLVVNGQVQTWFTGYAHLQNTFVLPFQVITSLKTPIGESGSTGEGGPHLHFEVRFPHQLNSIAWIDPWAEPSLWIDSPPVSAENSN
ncbi:MAG: M23 family metallopeptidase, partial [Anaerolineae bacterium]|nr:M23 family metallopeptidase [Anaerolineae bacterium]